jgi:hypothetical protein
MSNDLFYLAIVVIMYGIYIKARNRRTQQKMEIQTPLLKQNVNYNQEFVQGMPSTIFNFMFANSDPWINRFSIDRQPRDLQERKKAKEQEEESQRIRNLVL